MVPSPMSYIDRVEWTQKQFLLLVIGNQKIVYIPFLIQLINDIIDWPALLDKMKFVILNSSSKNFIFIKRGYYVYICMTYDIYMWCNLKLFSPFRIYLCLFTFDLKVQTSGTVAAGRLFQRGAMHWENDESR